MGMSTTVAWIVKSLGNFFLMRLHHTSSTIHEKRRETFSAEISVRISTRFPIVACSCIILTCVRRLYVLAAAPLCNITSLIVFRVSSAQQNSIVV
jgi:hypothetical protein